MHCGASAPRCCATANSSCCPAATTCTWTTRRAPPPRSATSSLPDYCFDFTGSTSLSGARRAQAVADLHGACALHHVDHRFATVLFQRQHLHRGALVHALL